MRIIAILLLATSVFLVSCERDADVASRNISEAADNFEILRRVIFYNGITGDYILSIEGYCSIKDSMGQLEVTVKVDSGKYLKHFLGLSDNVSYFSEQLDAANVSSSHYRVTFKPSVILPNVDVR